MAKGWITVDVEHDVRGKCLGIRRALLETIPRISITPEEAAELVKLLRPHLPPDPEAMTKHTFNGLRMIVAIKGPGSEYLKQACDEIARLRPELLEK